ncbi:MAG: sialate O-acetylesterase [Opitutae bacterium]
MRSFTNLILLIASSLSALAVTLPPVIGNHMILQRDLPVPIWGWGEKGEKITVSFADQSKSATVGKNGEWMVKLDKLKANSQPSTLTVKGNNEIKVKNILVGEVWICSGQSNMEWKVAQCSNSKEEIAAANHPNIRLFDVPGHTVHPLPQTEGPNKGEWKTCSPATIGNFSAAGYYFGRRVHKELNVPVGLVGSNWGGTRIEPWTTLAGFNAVPELAETAEKVKAYTEDTKVKSSTPSAIYNSMVHPLTPFALRGAIWYQGESNGGEGITYYQKKHALVKGWRNAFQNPKLAFYWVQLCNFKQPGTTPGGGDGWAKLREAQTQALDIPHTGMAIIIDLADAHNPNDIHPKNKQDVGSRLAQWALHQTYDKKNMVPSGPLFSSHKIKGNQVHLSFKNIGKGLMVGKKEKLDPTKEVKNGTLKHFSIAGADKKWHWADAKIVGDQVVLSSKEVKEPKAARYAYTMNPADANLYNKDGLPAGPFRTDDW